MEKTANLRKMYKCAIVRVSKSVETAAGKKIKRQRIHLLILPQTLIGNLMCPSSCLLFCLYLPYPNIISWN